MKKILNILTISLIALIFVACGSTPVVEEKIEETPVVEIPIVEEPEPIIEEDEEVQLVIEEPLVPEIDDDEFARSTKGLNGVTKSKTELAEDKAEIFKVIEELQIIMQNQDFDAWLTYLTDESKEIYSVPRKIKRGTSVYVNNGLEDYFLTIFIPVRKESTVSEIRYESADTVRVVGIIESNGKKRIRTYYNFERINGKWLVVLPTDILVD